MAVKKFAISIPEDVMAQVDQAASDRGVTRSRFISEVLQTIAKLRSDAEITRRINALFEDPDVASEQSHTAEAFRQGISMDEAAW